MPVCHRRGADKLLVCCGDGDIKWMGGVGLRALRRSWFLVLGFFWRRNWRLQLRFALLRDSFIDGEMASLLFVRRGLST